VPRAVRPSVRLWLNKSFDGSERRENDEWSVAELAVYVNTTGNRHWRPHAASVTVTIGHRQGQASSRLTHHMVISVCFLASVVFNQYFVFENGKRWAASPPFHWFLSPCFVPLPCHFPNPAIGLKALPTDILHTIPSKNLFKVTRQSSSAETIQETTK